MQAAFGACFAVALLSSVAHAKSWKQWAPGPLASDSSYASLVARPADSLTVAQLLWVAVQRDWRLERDTELAAPSASIAESGHPHLARRTDERFAELVSRPYATLSDKECAWLVEENAAQRVARESSSGGGGSALVGGVILGALIGAVVAVGLIGYAFNHTKF